MLLPLDEEVHEMAVALPGKHVCLLIRRDDVHVRLHKLRVGLDHSGACGAVDEGGVDELEGGDPQSDFCGVEGFLRRGERFFPPSEVYPLGIQKNMLAVGDSADTDIISLFQE